MNFDDMMAELRKEYIDSIPQKVADIRSHLAAKDVATLRDDFHKLKGSGKTYGVPEISDLGARMERLFLQAPNTGLAAGELAIGLLQAIYDSRLKGQPFDIQSREEFKKISEP